MKLETTKKILKHISRPKKITIKDNGLREIGDVEILKVFTYNENERMTISIFDKKSKSVFIGTIGKSSWSKEEAKNEKQI